MSLDTSPFISRADSTDSSEGEKYPFKEDIEAVRALLPRSRKRRLLYSTTKAVIILLAGWGFIAIVFVATQSISTFWRFRQNDVYRPETLPPGLSNCLCGHTKDEALSFGCVYDSLAAAWLPRACRDDALTSKFDHAGPGPGGAWNYFLDSNGTVPLSKAEIAELGPQGGAFWTTAAWHVAHCVFYWQKYKRMGETGVIMEARFDTLPHVKHCGKLMMNKEPDYFYLIEVPVRMNGSIDVGATPASKIGGKIPNPSDISNDQHSQQEHKT
ncbi:hypothetical protein F5X97DRAFT_318086 [Nemania serpens]|nr:hypothetical protein F5X97DRAFT_318086 [Nemania serpens]